MKAKNTLKTIRTTKEKIKIFRKSLQVVGGFLGLGLLAYVVYQYYAHGQQPDLFTAMLIILTLKK
jgi:uncharacterized membrane protein YebE (DUF533 family)